MKQAIGIGMAFLSLGLATASARADGRSGAGVVLAEVGAGFQGVASGGRFLVAVGTSGVPIGMPGRRGYEVLGGNDMPYDSTAAYSHYSRRGMRLFWINAQVGISEAGNGLPYADIRVVPVSYEEAFGRRSHIRVEALPVEYQREVSFGVEHRLSAYLIGFNVHSDTQDYMQDVMGDPEGNRNGSFYVDFAVRGLGALFTRLHALGEGAGVSVGSADFAVGINATPMRRGDSGWVVRAELLRTRLALDFANDVRSGRLTPTLQWEVMARIAAGHRFSDGMDGGEIEFFVHGGLRGVHGISDGGLATGGAVPGNFTPVIEAGVMGRF